MFRLQYAEASEDDQKDARERERMALDHSIALMEQAKASGNSPAESTQAILFTSKLWTVLIEDLANADNGLPKQLKAQIISIGIWILRELESMRADHSKSFDDLLAVSKAIRDGIT